MIMCTAYVTQAGRDPYAISVCNEHKSTDYMYDSVSSTSAKCFPPSGCINGVCVAPNHCSCAVNWDGAQCDIGKNTCTCT